jgi:hypothetical protein
MSRGVELVTQASEAINETRAAGLPEPTDHPIFRISASRPQGGSAPEWGCA